MTVAEPLAENVPLSWPTDGDETAPRSADATRPRFCKMLQGSAFQRCLYAQGVTNGGWAKKDQLPLLAVSTQRALEFARRQIESTDGSAGIRQIE